MMKYFKKKGLKSKCLWFAVIIILVAIPFIINESYKTPNGYKTIWDATDLLLFYGSLLAFIGTMFLGITAISQNQKLSEFNDKLINMQKKSKMASLGLHDNVLRENKFIDLINFRDDYLKKCTLLHHFNGSYYEFYKRLTDKIKEDKLPVKAYVLGYSGAEHMLSGIIPQDNCNIKYNIRTGELVNYELQMPEEIENSTHFILLLLENYYGDMFFERIQFKLRKNESNGRTWFTMDMLDINIEEADDFYKSIEIDLGLRKR